MPKYPPTLSTTPSANTVIKVMRFQRCFFGRGLPLFGLVTPAGLFSGRGGALAYRAGGGGPPGLRIPWLARCLSSCSGGYAKGEDVLSSGIVWPERNGP